MSLYEERAALHERRAAHARDQVPALEHALQNKQFERLMAIGMMSKPIVDDMEQEIRWVERQICALLSNPALSAHTIVLKVGGTPNGQRPA